MAIDYGTKRVGIAVSDPLGLIAHGLTTLHPSELFEFLKKYFSKETVDEVIVGDPKGLDGKETDGSRFANDFVRQFIREFPGKKTHRFDERFTSVIAKRTLLASGVKKEKRKEKALVDEISATIILQDFLQSKK